MYLLDTTIFSYMLRDDSRLDLYNEDLKSEGPFYISAMTVYELYTGAEIDRWGAKRRAEMERHVEQFTVLPMDQSLGKIYAQVFAAARTLGCELHVADALIVATAKRFELKLVTHDRDMLIADNFGIKVICHA